MSARVGMRGGARKKRGTGRVRGREGDLNRVFTKEDAVRGRGGTGGGRLLARRGRGRGRASCAFLTEEPDRVEAGAA